MKKRTKILFFIVIFLVLVVVSSLYIVVSNISNEYSSEVLRVSFLDVGQGDSILIQAPFGQNILIDGGENDLIIQKLSKELPWWDRKIDLIILTHPHADHVGGLIHVVKRYDVKKIIYTGVVHTSPDFIAWLNEVKARKIPLLPIDHKQNINLGEDIDLRIIYPSMDITNKEGLSLNNSSIVSQLQYNEVKFLFTGDIEREIEYEIITNESDLKSNVLKAAHHGSASSNTNEFIEKVSPQYVVIQSGLDNEYGHPHLNIIKRFEKNDIKILRNDQSGTIVFETDGNNLNYISER